MPRITNGFSPFKMVLVCHFLLLISIPETNRQTNERPKTIFLRPKNLTDFSPPKLILRDKSDKTIFSAGKHFLVRACLLALHGQDREISWIYIFKLVNLDFMQLTASFVPCLSSMHLAKPANLVGPHKLCACSSRLHRFKYILDRLLP